MIPTATMASVDEIFKVSLSAQIDLCTKQVVNSNMLKQAGMPSKRKLDPVRDPSKPMLQSAWMAPNVALTHARR